MDWALNWFESISQKPISCRKRKNDTEQTSNIRKKNIRHTPSTAGIVAGAEPTTFMKNAASPKFIMNGNWAPSPQVLESNMLSAYVVQTKEMNDFFALIENDKIIKGFLDSDKCFKYADKFILACVFAYFKRCNFKPKEYNRINFFCCLYLAHDMEEDDEDLKYEIFPWALGKMWRQKISSFLLRKETIWARMNYRAIVSYMCCKELMSIMPAHPIWRRTRLTHHGYAIRTYVKPRDSNIPKGPDSSSRPCPECDIFYKHLFLNTTYTNISREHQNDSESTRVGCFSEVSELMSELIESEDEAFNPSPENILRNTGEESWLSQETYHSISLYSRNDGSFNFAEE
ncbi:Speedy protein A [Clonorchis sinensis]|uniref:Speedy protein A n=1 Tax=Clonorchis sinensis TaxID=79923 RepID=A0A8T1MHD9_CLOSI|nr:Speedy protein A [Clonorchis sinensis]